MGGSKRSKSLSLENAGIAHKNFKKQNDNHDMNWHFNHFESSVFLYIIIFKNNNIYMLTRWFPAQCAKIFLNYFIFLFKLYFHYFWF